jgi:peptidoglycan hydrolase-like protein with peptidoglycan-binding domain
MRLRKSRIISSGLFLTLALPAFASPRIHRGPTAPHPVKKTVAAAKPKPAGQRAIDSERASQIQAALIKNGYMTGTPSGTWDATSEAAMQKFQADNSWQTKFVPDARAIIKLGLGPTSNSATLAPTEIGEPKTELPAAVSPNTPRN